MFNKVYRVINDVRRSDDKSLCVTVMSYQKGALYMIRHEKMSCSIMRLTTTYRLDRPLQIS